jgi:hypothetical protein
MAKRKRGELPHSFPDAYAAVAQHLQTQLGDNLAVQAGPPTAVPVTPASDRQKAEAWNTPHPAATDEAMWGLAQQKYAEHRGAGLPEDKAIAATAEDLTHFRYRARQPLYTLGTTSWGEQVAEAKRLARLAGKQGEEQGAQSLAVPAAGELAGPTPPAAAPALPPMGSPMVAPAETGAQPGAAGPPPPAPRPPGSPPQGGLSSGY